jgi:hypothetical protein
MCIYLKQSHITTPCRTSSFAAILESTDLLTFVESCKQYRSTVEFKIIYWTALMNLGIRVNAPKGYQFNSIAVGPLVFLIQMFVITENLLKRPVKYRM